MGLIDGLGERAFDALLQERTDRKKVRQQFRAELIQQLRSYSQHIEQTRIAFVQLRDAIELGNFARLPLPPSAVTERANSEYDSVESLSRSAQLQLQACGLDTPAIRAAQTTIEQHLARVFTPGPGTRDEDLADYAALVARRAKDLDDAWAGVRVLLDEVLEVQAVLFLRRFRHDMRFLVLTAENAATRLSRSMAPTAYDTVFVVAIINHLLYTTDLWNSRIVGLRQEYK